MKQSLKVYKIGGGIIDNPLELKPFLEDFSKVEGNKILVHGGGKGANKTLEKLGIKPQMVGGRRITNHETLEVVTQLYAGKINKQIVADLQKNKVNALGLSGADGNSIEAVKRPVKDIDYGFVGDMKENGVNNQLFQILLNNDFTPVCCAITHDKNGQLLNTNADTIASTLAVSLSSLYEVELHFCFDKIGVLKDVNDDNSLIPEITSELYTELLKENIIHDGMRPKLENAFSVVKSGVTKVVLTHSSNINNETGTLISF